MLLAFEGVSQMIIGMEVLERTIVMFDGCLSFRQMRDRGLWWSLASLLVLRLLVEFVVSLVVARRYESNKKDGGFICNPQRSSEAR